MIKAEIYFQLNWMQTAEEIDDLFLGDAEVSFLLMDITMLSNFTCYFY